jgi:hypothetical protein
MLKPFPAFCLLVWGLIFAASELGAQSAAMEDLRARLKSPDQFGTQCCQMLSIPVAAFVPKSSDAFQVSVQAYGYTSFQGSMWAPVSLPTGTALDYIDLYYADFSQRQTCAELFAYTGPTLLGDPPGESGIGSVCSPGLNGGYGYAIETIGGTIDNSAWFSGGAQYAVSVSASGSPIDTGGFKGVTIWWHREVSPSPFTATFNDVPTNHPQFQFIEALAESAITVGCGGGNYCPDSPLTRGQMAVFLSKALGLYWPF